MNISKEYVYPTSNQGLGMREQFVHWVSHTSNQKRIRINIFNALLALFRHNKLMFWYRIITINKTWIHHYTTESKIQLKTMDFEGRIGFEKGKDCSFGWKVMAIVF